jgi:uncharacterized protein YjbI with pentapeptide repeats
MIAEPSHRPSPPRLPKVLDEAAHPFLSSEERWEALSVRHDLAGQIAEDIEIEGCRFTGAGLLGVELIRCRITDSVFEQCDLSAASLSGAGLTRVRFVDCRLSGADLSEARLDDVLFEQCRLNEANLRMIHSKRLEFLRCDLQGLDFYGASLAGAGLFDSTLSGVELSKANLTGGRLHGSHIEGLKGAEGLRGTTIDSTQVVPLALELLRVFHVTVDDDRDP